jgi:hypothetical protein
VEGMRQESWEFFAFVLFILAMFFLFQGEPDVWDTLHKMAMGMCK